MEKIILFLNEETFAEPDGGRTVMGHRSLSRSGTLTTAYTVRDHLGSTRAVVGRDGTVLECDEYYPFGQRHDLGRNHPVLASNRLKYNGKEQQDIASLSLPYLDYGARLYNPAILRWNAQDPLQEKYYGISPFAYCADSPISRIDIMGLTDYFTITGEFYKNDGINDGRIRIVNQDIINSIKDYVDDINDSKQVFGFLNSSSSSLSVAYNNGILSSNSALTIITHYNETGLKLFHDDNMKDKRVFEYRIKSKQIAVNLKEIMNSKKVYDNSYAISNLINAHEYQHHLDNINGLIQFNVDNKVSNRLFLEERAVEAQKAHPTWEKAGLEEEMNIYIEEERKK